MIVGVAALATIAYVVSLLVKPADPEPVAEASPGKPQASSAAATTSPAAPTPAAPVTLAFAGDVHFTGRTEGLLAQSERIFGSISSVLAVADVAMVNLETAITERGVEEPKEFHFRAPETALDALAAAGVDVTTLANNHAVDYGPLGLEDTLAAVDSSPIPVVGIGPNAARAYAPHRLTVRGTSISIFGISQVPDRTFQAWTATNTDAGIATTQGRDRLIAGVSQATAAGDVVVVYLHWGIERNPCPTTDMADLATELAAAGADAIVGSHAHLLLGSGYLDQPGSTAYVSYGLGNFLWWRSDPETDDTGILTLTVSNGSVRSAVMTPALIDDTGQPRQVIGPMAVEKIDDFEDLRPCADLLPTPAV